MSARTDRIEILEAEARAATLESYRFKQRADEIQNDADRLKRVSDEEYETESDGKWAEMYKILGIKGGK